VATTERASGVGLIATLLLVGAILVNLAQFRDGDRSADDNFDAIHRNDTADITELVYAECEWCRDRYSIHLALRVIAPGSTVIVPADNPNAGTSYDAGVLAQRLYSLGLVERVDFIAARDLPTGIDPGPYVLASGPGGERGAPWAVAVAPPPRPQPAADPEGYLEAALRAGEHRDPDRPAREFVLLQWPDPAVDDPRDLLLETSLLADPVREELTR
jgi:hypothetical protein